MEENNKFICSIDGWNELDESRCFLANFTFILYNIKFGYICTGFLIMIILISLFGRIKENYRWFILNQAVWDLIITYDYLNDNQIYYFFFRGKGAPSRNLGNEYFSPFVIEIIDSNPYSSLLLLSFTRFIALYFMNFYEKLTKKRRVFYLIIIYNFIIIFLHIDNGLEQLRRNRDINMYEICLANVKSQNSTNYDICPGNSYDFINICLENLATGLRYAVYLKPFICLSLSFIATIMIIARLLKHAKFQLKQNRKNFLKSLRIFMVILFQTFINISFFLVEFLMKISFLMKDFFYIKVVTFELDSCEYEIGLARLTSCIEIKLPNWLHSRIGLTDPMIFPAIRQIRIFLEAIIILSIMTGYREAISDITKFIFIFFKNLRKSYEKFMLYFKLTKVTAY